MTARSCIFGTDGVRDRAGEGYLSEEGVERIGGAIAAVLAGEEAFPDDLPPERPRRDGARIIIGKDTRRSGDAIEGILAGVLSRAGFRVTLLGVIPTPGVAHAAVAAPDTILAVMISASHNPAEYNGIKLLAPAGAKVSDRFEAAVSRAFHDGLSPPSGSGRGEIVRGAPELVRSYAEHLAGVVRRRERLEGVRVALDMANGATAGIARQVFEGLGADVVSVGDAPDGDNINAGCGALHPGGLARLAVESGAAYAFAFDGDGDRVIPVTESGSVLDGDHVLAISGRRLHAIGELPGDTVVATVMSNIGLERSLDEVGVALERTAVGDRFVYAAMVRGDRILGGEQSGHLIFLDASRTGDGILAALRLIDHLPGDGVPSLEDAAGVMTRYPQVLRNYRVPRKVPLDEIDEVCAMTQRAEEALGREGRVVLRYSGTEPLARVMVEGPEKDLIDRLARDIGAAIVAGIRS